MGDPQRPVDAAMSEKRPAKQVIRGLWVDEVRYRKPSTPSSVPFYLTLAGANGLDIQALISAGLIETTENKVSIADVDNRRVIAVERDSPSVLMLQRKYPGLKVVEGNIFNYLRGTSPITYPTGADQRMMRASVINLDLNGPLGHEPAGFPVLEAIVKLGALHKASDTVQWSLLLTLRGEVIWDEPTQRDAQSLLRDAWESQETLARGCENLLGSTLYAKIKSSEYVDFSTQEMSIQQSFLMVFVPVTLAQRINPQGWRLQVIRSVRYGAGPSTAPMVMWIMRFLLDARSAGTPSAVMRDSLSSAVSSCAQIDEQGVLTNIRK